MMVPRISLLLALVDYVLTDEIGTQDGCLSAETQCSLDHDCRTRFNVLKQCTNGSGIEHLQPAARNECMIAAHALQSSQLFKCKCKRGMKKERICLRIYWIMHQSHISGYNELEASPYEYSMPGPTWGLDYGRLASLVSGPKVQQPANVNHCLDATQACNVDETCKQYRNEYARNCLKPSCNRQKCHKSLRRVFDLMSEEYKYPILFCPCEDSTCAERRRQTIVPACSFEEADKKNCLTLQDMCKKHIICKSRLADFQTNCQPSKKSASYCFRENYNACLQSYTGLIGTVLTPNYVSNSSSNISIWCTCVNSGNQQEECENLLNLFTSNNCLRKSIDSYTNSLLFHLPGNKQPPLTTTRRLSFNFPCKDRSSDDANDLTTLDLNEDCNCRGDKLKASKEKSLSEKITDCDPNSGTDIQSSAVVVSCAIYIFISIIENAI
ncbi:GDNF family receptor alpha-4-like isoform X2 [Mustelus asterias]